MDHKKAPLGCIINDSYRCDSYTKYELQYKWNLELKQNLWLNIIYNKLLNQSCILNKCLNKSIEIPSLAYNSIDVIEAKFAKLYFHELFGKSFNRREENDINSALNYGYAILASLITRNIYEFGYNTLFGIHHCNKLNKFNLSYDVIEPFRPIIDKFVYMNKNKEFNSKYKKDILLYIEIIVIIYKDKHYNIETAIYSYLLDLFKYLKGENIIIGTIDYE